MSYEMLKTAHFVGMILLLGAGGASAFYKFVIDRSNSLEMIVQMNKLVVLADWLFTTPAIILQPITGFALMHTLGFTISDCWIYISLALYTVSTLLWLIAVYFQIRMKKIAIKAYEQNTQIPQSYFKYAKIWFYLGFPSFFAMVAIIFLMVYKVC